MRVHIIAMAKHWSPKNKEDFYEVSTQSTRVFCWKCPRGHEWRAKMAQVKSGRVPLCTKCRELHNKLKDKLKE